MVIGRGLKPQENALFADDLMLFARSDENCCDNVLSILNTFYEEFGQIINFDKSKLFIYPNSPRRKAKGLLKLKLGISLTQESRPWSANVNDSTTWNVESNGQFSIKSSYSLCTQSPEMPTGVLKMNTDGCSWGETTVAGQVGCGGFIRHDRADWIKGFYCRLPDVSAIEAELWAIYRGLTIILEDGLNQVEMETDFQTAVEIIQEGLHERTSSRNIVQELCLLLRRCNSKMSYMPREANRCAVALAKMGADQNETLVILQQPPKALVRLLAEDRVGVVFNRP
ncbi:hypothetical protein Acr_11g0009600 [Actinidia rufa]|uniref:RNase H type-1 domain-containing protein n=1 Tax=Actinidia rufa TaxID=165716 RepID=A0A7J0FD73_9ERIC|nr:hypothetical protein Acr_11g0009600 [Actinidia rufa]